MKCVIAFFGIDRRLDITAPTIRSKIVDPARRSFNIEAMSFLWAPRAIDNPRSGEQGTLQAARINLLPEGEHRVEAPLDLATDRHFLRLADYGDFWKDGGKSLANLYHQLVSLDRVTTMALTVEPDCVAFVRPDLAYLDSWSAMFERTLVAPSETVFLPHWQPHGGLNDRFALCIGERAIRAYGQRLANAVEFCRETGSPLHGEELLEYSVDRPDISVERIRQRASRVRLDGSMVQEDFSRNGWKPALRVLAGRMRRAIFPIAGGE